MQRRLTPSSIRKTALSLAALLLVFYVGYRAGREGIILPGSSPTTPKVVVNRNVPVSRDLDFALFWDVWSRLEKNYIDKSKLEQDKMFYGAISGMVSALGDPYTVFLPPKENGEYKQDLNGEFEGIGAQLGAKDERVVVIAPLKDHPAEKAGLLAGDWIVKVDGTETTGWTVPQAVAKIRGKKGTKVTLSVAREGITELKDYSIVRDTIIVKSVEFELKEATGSACQTGTCPKEAYIRLTRFGDKTNDEWNDAVRQVRAELQKDPSLGLVLDMRNNPGGYLQSAIYIASEFIKSGVVVNQENADGTKETYSVSRTGNLLDIPLVVLINKGSASAAEIVAGALNDHERATLVGETTFGKGSIQMPEDLQDGSGIHITTARWVLPKGEWIDKKGIAPDIALDGPTASNSADLQLERAIELLLK